MRSAISLRRLLPYLGVLLALCIAAIWLPFFLGCSLLDGACVGTGPVEECKQGWTSAECADWNSTGVNGDTWTFYGGQSCQDLGYTVQISDGSYVRTSSGR